MWQAVLFLVAFVAPFGESHLTITFPPARQYALDFLDNVRTSAPCGGMTYKENGPITTLETGKVVSATWHVAYPHRGGVRFELLNATTNEVIANLTGDGYQYTDDSTAISHDLTFDDSMKCDHCVLRIERQAGEWTYPADPKGYLFWSCADVKIMGPATEATTCYAGQCLNGGTCTAGTCSCPKTYVGDRCQYKNDCEDDTDCNGGKCEDIQSTYYPKKVCFCSGGKMGRYCGKNSPVSTAKKTDAELEGYYHNQLYADPLFDMYWKLIGDSKDEIEIVLRVKTNTWVALGWRPSTVTTTCRNFPDLTAAPSGHAEGTAEPEGTPEPTGRRRRAVVMEGSYARELSREKRNTETNVIKDLCEAGNVSEAIAWATANYNAVPGATAAPEPEGEGTPAPEGEGTPAPEGEGTPAPEGEGTPAPEGEGTPAPEGEGTAEPEGEPEGTGGALHPMDCQDIVYISASDNGHRIYDAYTRDRSTPQPDSFFGGTDDLTAAAASREDGVLHALFRRKLMSTDSADHTLPDGNAMFIWARGQDPVRFYHWPLSGLENCMASNYDYYKINELKYHGTKATQRGTAAINVYDDPDNTETTVEGSYGIPEGCQGTACKYEAKWKYRESTDTIQFTLIAEVALGQWAAIGFSEDQMMINSDAVVVWMDDPASRPTITDRKITARTSSGVALDQNQKSTYVSGSYVNGRMTVVFTKPRVTDNADDVPLDKCQFFLYAYGGNANSNGLTAHSAREPSTAKICIGDSGSARVVLSSILNGAWIVVLLVTSRLTMY